MYEIMKCVKAMEHYKVGDEVTSVQLLDAGHPQFIIDYFFVAKPEPKPATIKLPIIHDKGMKQLGCWVPCEYVSVVFEESPVDRIRPSGPMPDTTAEST